MLEPNRNAMATAESSTDHRLIHIESLPLIDLRLLSQSELYSLSLSSSSSCASHLHRRFDDDSVIPKIDRSVFNESAGSRKQTFSRLRLAPRNKQIPLASAPNPHIPLYIREPVDEENSQIITLLQQLFGVESLRNAKVDDDCLVPVQVEFKDRLPESAAMAFHIIPIDVVDGIQRKRKRGRPRKSENAGIRGEGEPKKVGGGGVTMPVVNDKGFSVDAVAFPNVGDPFGDELDRRTQGLITESQLSEFMERLNGEWGSNRKKRKIVPATDLSDILPRGWKIVLSLKRRASVSWIVCRRYVSPDGHQFESFKEVSAYLPSLCGAQDISHLKSSYTDGGLQLSSTINVASQSGVGHVPTVERRADCISRSLHLAGTPVHTDYEQQSTLTSSTGSEKLSTSYGNFNNILALSSKMGDTTSGPRSGLNHQFEDKQLSVVDKNDANSVKGCSLKEERVCNVHDEKLADAIDTNDAACNLYIPLVVTAPFSNNNSGICQFSDEINAVKYIKSDISNFACQDGNTGCYETIPCGNEQVHVDNNGHWLSVSLLGDCRQDIGFESGVLASNIDVEKISGSNLDYRHFISSLQDMEIGDGKKPEGCTLVPSQNEPRHGSINGTNVVGDSAQEWSFLNDQNSKRDNPLDITSETNLLTPAYIEHSFDDNVNKVSAGTFDAVKAVGAGREKPHLDSVACSNDAALDAYASTSIILEISQGPASVPIGGNMLNQFDEQSYIVNNANESGLLEKAKGEEVNIFQSDSTGLAEFG